MLDREEYVEQAYFFRTLRERIVQNVSTQDLLGALRHEVLSTTKLFLAIDFMAAELRLTGGMSTAMAHLEHYFTPYQTFIVREAERETGRFDFRIGLEILEKEAQFRTQGPVAPQALFLYQFETLCRIRLGYDRGLEAMAGDPTYDDTWRPWLLWLSQQVGLIDFAELIYLHSVYCPPSANEGARPVLFGTKEGQIALAHRRKDPLFLFSSLQRHLGYPSVPRAAQDDANRYVIPTLQRKIERMETRVRMLEEELRGGINLARFYVRPSDKGTDNTPE